MNDIVIKKGTTLCVLVTDIEITLDTGELYELSNQDIVEFQVRQVTRNKKQVLVNEHRPISVWWGKICYSESPLMI